MSGWGCRYQLEDTSLSRCLLLRKECKPGIPGCVLYKKVCFISDVEQTQPKRATQAASSRRSRAKPVAAKKK
jgi:hypothetical protein